MSDPAASPEMQAAQAPQMTTLLVQHGLGEAAPRAYFQLIEGRLHVPTVRDHFKLSTASFNEIIYPTDAQGFTYCAFQANAVLMLAGDPLSVRGCKLLLVRLSENSQEPLIAGGKRRMSQAEDILGLYPLPQPSEQPSTVAELSASINAFLQATSDAAGVAAANAAGGYLFRYSYFGDAVPIQSDQSLVDAISYFRNCTTTMTDDDALLHCRLYLTPLASRDAIRARISGLLDAAAATGRVPKNELDPNQPQADPQGLLGPNDGSESDATAQARRHQASYEQQQYEQLQFELAQNSAVHAHLQQQQQRMLSGQGGMQPGGAMLPGQQARMVGGYNGLGSPVDGGLGGVPGAVTVPTTKESRTRLADGRFRSDEQHQRKMADMTKKCNELFDGGIANEFEILDHRKIKCRVCAHVAATYSPYHTDCVRKHFLRHHEQMLMERGIDLSKWRKEYEAGATGRQRHRADSSGVRGLHGQQAQMQMQGLDPNSAMHSLAATQQQQQQQAMMNHFAAAGVAGGMGTAGGVDDGLSALMAAPPLMSGADQHGRVGGMMPFDLASLGLHMDPNALGMGLPAALLASLQQQQQQQGMSSLEQAGQIMLAAVAAAAAQSQQAAAGPDGFNPTGSNGAFHTGPSVLDQQHMGPDGRWPAHDMAAVAAAHARAMREQGLDDGTGQQHQVDQAQQQADLIQQHVEMQHQQQQQQADLLQQQQLELMAQHASLQQQQQQHQQQQQQMVAEQEMAAAQQSAAEIAGVNGGMMHHDGSLGNVGEHHGGLGGMHTGEEQHQQQQQHHHHQDQVQGMVEMQTGAVGEMSSLMP